eukprot:tig00000269_g23762.t1
MVNNPFMPIASDGPPEQGIGIFDDNNVEDLVDMGGAHPSEWHIWASYADRIPAKVRKSAQIGVEATTREEALRWFEKGIEAGPLFYGEKNFEDARSDGEMWDYLPMRGFYRCLFAAANVLRRMNRYKDAYAKYKRLLEFDPRVYALNACAPSAKHGTVINPYPSFIECLLGLGKWGEAAAYLFSRDEAMLEFAFKPSSYLTRTYTRILVTLKLGKSPKLPGQAILQYLLTTFWDGVCPGCADRVPRKPSKEEVAAGHTCRPDPVLALLAGEPLPERRDPGTVTFASPATVRTYVRQFGKHWRAEPGILAQVIEMDRVVRRRCAEGPRRECPTRVIEEFGCGCCGFPGAPKPPKHGSKAAAGAHACAACGRSGDDLLRCGCREVYYCDTKCQKTHWCTHKAACKLQGAAAAASKRSAENAPPANSKGAASISECSACGRSSDDLLRCSQCRQAQYCDAACQRKHWAAHKAACTESAQKASGTARAGAGAAAATATRA